MLAIKEMFQMIQKIEKFIIKNFNEIYFQFKRILTVHFRLQLKNNINFR